MQMNKELLSLFRRPLLHAIVVALGLVLSTSSYGQSKAEKVDKLYGFFNVQESAYLDAQRVKIQVDAAAARALAEKSIEARAVSEPQVKAALDRFLRISEMDTPEFGNSWKSFLNEQLTEEELDAAIAFVLSPAGKKSLGAQGIAQSMVNASIQMHFTRRIRPAFEELETELRSLK